MCPGDDATPNTSREQNRTEYVNSRGIPEVGRPYGGASVEIYRSVNGRYSWRVVAMADGDSPEALRAAKALALDLDNELHDGLRERHRQRRASQQ